MKVVITKIIAANPDGDEVAFTTIFGSGRGIWKSSLLTTPTERDVEFSFAEPLVWGETLTLVANPEAKFELLFDGTAMNIVGLAEAIESDGCIYLRMGQSLILANATGTPPLNAINSFTQAKAKTVYLYDTNI